MFFDTHTHLQFSVYSSQIDLVLSQARKAGVQKIIACGTNLPSSHQAVKLAHEFHGVYAAVGIHPHHIYEHFHSNTDLREHIGDIELLLQDPSVVAVGEVGIDKHIYKKTKYLNYRIDEAFIAMQKDFFERQLKLALKYKKSLIIHNRQASLELLDVLSQNWDPFFSGRAVFHCCEPDQKLLDFAIQNHVYIGIDGDITYEESKQVFLTKVPLDLLVLETDSPFLTPSPIRSTQVINHPANLSFIAEFVAREKKESLDNIIKVAMENSLQLFNLR